MSLGPGGGGPTSAEYSVWRGEVGLLVLARRRGHSYLASLDASCWVCWLLVAALDRIARVRITNYEICIAATDKRRVDME